MPLTVDVALSLADIIFAAALLATMTARRVYLSAPVFVLYIGLDLVSTAVGLAIYQHSGFPGWYEFFVLFSFLADALVSVGFMVELGRNLLRFNREFRPHWDVAIWLFVFAAFLIFSLSRWSDFPGRSWSSNVYVLGMRAVEVFQFAGFLALVSWSTVRKLRWPDRELRIATGFGISAFGWFVVALLHSQWVAGPAYHLLDQLGDAADLVAMGYWLHYFWLDADRDAPVRNSDAELNNLSSPGDSDPTLRLRGHRAAAPEQRGFRSR